MVASSWISSAALSLAAIVGAGVGWLSVPSPTLSRETVVGCQTVVWVMQRTGYGRDVEGNVIPIDRRPDLTARGDAIAAALVADQRRWSVAEVRDREAFMNTRAVDAIWERVETEAVMEHRLEHLAADCERKLGLRL